MAAGQAAMAAGVVTVQVAAGAATATCSTAAARCHTRIWQASAYLLLSMISGGNGRRDDPVPVKRYILGA